MDISIQLICPCNLGHIYKTNSTYKKHLTSARHENYEVGKLYKDSLVRCKELENENETLKFTNGILIEKIKDLTKFKGFIKNKINGM